MVIDWIAELERKQRAERGRLLRRSPQSMSHVMSRLMSRRGYGRVRANEGVAGAWQEAVGDRFAKSTRVGHVRRGVLDVIVGNSTLIQELTFSQNEIIDKLQNLIPEQNIREIRFRSGKLD